MSKFITKQFIILVRICFKGNLDIMHRDKGCLTAKATLSPRIWLSIGDPKQEAKAICVFPDLATTVSATQSAMQLPRASTVNPRIPVYSYNL